MSAKRAFVVSSGMSALDVVARLVKAGEEIIAGDDLYGGECIKYFILGFIPKFLFYNARFLDNSI